MIDAGKLLGGLLGNSLGKGNLGSQFGTKAVVGMGVLGVAMAAAEHFLQQRSAPQPHQAPQQTITPPPGVPQGGPGASGAHAAPPPPPPPPGSRVAPPAPPTLSQEDQQTATLLIRAMIAAAHADGVLDTEEENRIFGRLQSAGLTDEEQSFIRRELHAPWPVEAIAAQAKTPDLAKQVYTASFLAIVVDTQAEESHLQRLQELLSLDQDIAAGIRKDLSLA